MHNFRSFRIVIVGMAAIVAADVLGAFASLRLQFPYGNLSALSYLITAGTAFLAARQGGMKEAAVAGAAVSFVEATLGWALSWQIGPGRLPPVYYDHLEWTIGMVVVAVTLKGTVLGLLGGLLTKLRRRSIAAA